ncbi:MAG: hypothetical protein ACTSX2_10535 [Candidatus Thorarchaeota archaeon]
MTYMMGGRTKMGRSTEPGKYSPTQIHQEDHVLSVNYEHIPDQQDSSLKTTVKVWSRDQPFLLLRYNVQNISQVSIEDLKVYHLLDFDLGGPSSHDDDFGVFDSKSGIIDLWDDTPVRVMLASQPRVDAWDVAGPIRLRPSKFRRDLKNRSELGPADIAAAQQWNLGDLQPGDQRTIDIVIAAGRSKDETSSALVKAWEMFTKKIP